MSEEVRHHVEDVKPEPHRLCRCWVNETTSVAGVWTGREWWAEGRAITPTHWSYLLAVGNIYRGGAGPDNGTPAAQK